MFAFIILSIGKNFPEKIIKNCHIIFIIKGIAKGSDKDTLYEIGTENALLTQANAEAKLKELRN